MADSFLDTFSPHNTLPEDLPADPFPLFQRWFDEARESGDQPNPNAMTLATVDADGTPSARIVLCKAIEADAGVVRFFTNYAGRKGRSLDNEPRAAVVFHWDHPDRQVRMEGRVTKSSAEVSDAYYASRAWESRLGAWASRQSEPLTSREQLLEQVVEAVSQLDVDIAGLMNGQEVDLPRPPHWGGFDLRAEAVELWLGGPGRVHDRARWERTGDGWSSTRLQP
ncbi:MAG: pyridoxamine 5'-phosphate oxidase [Planctomycetota bacterium]